MSQAFFDMCLELTDEPEKLAKFVKLYTNKEKQNYEKCHICEKTLTTHSNIYGSKGYCSKICFEFDSYILEGTEKSLIEYLDKLNMENNDDRRMPFHFANYIFETYKERFEKKIAYNIITLLLNHKNSRKAFIQYMSEYEKYDSYYTDSLTLEELVSYNLLKESNIRIIYSVFNRYGCSELSKQKDLPRESWTIPIIYEATIKLLREKNIFKKFIGYCPKLDTIVAPYIELEDIQICANSVILLKSLIEKFGFDTIKSAELYKYMYNKEAFDILYPVVDDDLLWFFVDKQLIHSHLNKYIFKDKNRFFSLLNKNKFTGDIKKLYNINHNVDSDFIKLIYYNVHALKKDDITLETFYTFCTNMSTINSAFTRWVCTMIRLFNEIDFSKNISDTMTLLDCVCISNKENTACNADLIIKAIDQGIFIKDEYIYTILYYCGHTSYSTYINGVNINSNVDKKCKESQELILKFDKERIEKLFGTFATIYNFNSEVVKNIREYLISNGYAI